MARNILRQSFLDESIFFLQESVLKHAFIIFLQESISCDKMVSELGQNGVIYTKTNYVTLKYVTDSWGTDANGFTLIITAFRDLNYGCHQRFQCSNSNICISHDLVCDNIHHCVDGADERSSEFCSCKFLKNHKKKHISLYNIISMGWKC